MLRVPRSSQYCCASASPSLLRPRCARDTGRCLPPTSPSVPQNSRHTHWAGLPAARQCGRGVHPHALRGTGWGERCRAEPRCRRTAAPGFVTVYPTGVSRPLASSINVDAAGLTIANLVTVPIGTGGTVDMYSLMTTDLVADVQGYYMPAVTATTGLFRPDGPIRLLDTRNPTPIHFGPLAAGEQLDVNVGALAGLPADAIAAALKITSPRAAASGFWTVYPAGTTRPTASNINVFGAGSTIANQVIAQLTSGASPCFTVGWSAHHRPRRLVHRT